MLRATHGHLASKNENKRQKNIWTVVQSHVRGHSHAQVLNLHVHAHTSGPDRHIHNQVIPAHGLEPCRACVNLCLSDHLPTQTDRWDHKERGQFN